MPSSPRGGTSPGAPVLHRLSSLSSSGRRLSFDAASLHALGSHLDTTLVDPYIQKPSHRPLHTQVALLQSERDRIVQEVSELRETVALLESHLREANSALSDLTERHSLTLTECRTLEAELSASMDACQTFASGAAENTQRTAALRSELTLATANIGQLTHRSSHLLAERTTHRVELRRRSAEMETLSAEIDTHDAELGRLQLALVTSLGETRWLREQVAGALRKNHSLKEQLATERTEVAQLSMRLGPQRAQLEAEASERVVLHGELEAAQEACRVAELRAEELQRRLADADAAKLDALVRADRAERALADERIERRAELECERAVQAEEEELSRQLEEAASALTSSAIAAERMRWSHTQAQRHALCERAWSRLCNGPGSSKGSQLVLNNVACASSSVEREAAEYGSQQQQQQLWRQQRVSTLSTVSGSGGSVVPRVPRAALVAATRAFAQAGLALSRATCDQPRVSDYAAGDAKLEAAPTRAAASLSVPSTHGLARGGDGL
jgi:hypothetical protein